MNVKKLVMARVESRRACRGETTTVRMRKSKSATDEARIKAPDAPVNDRQGRSRCGNAWCAIVWRQSGREMHYILQR